MTLDDEWRLLLLDKVTIRSDMSIALSGTCVCRPHYHIMLPHAMGLPTLPSEGVCRVEEESDDDNDDNMMTNLRRDDGQMFWRENVHAGRHMT